MTDIDDITLMAYADGELDEEKRRAVEKAISDDPEAKATVEKYRRSADLLKQTYGPFLNRSAEEDLPQTIRDYQPQEPAETTGTLFFFFPRLMTGKSWMAVAASIAIGVVVGGGGLQIAHQYTDMSGAPVSEEISLTTRGTASSEAGSESSFLHLVFESVADNAVSDQFNVKIEDSYKNVKGESCRQAKVLFPPGANLEGLSIKACKDEAGLWHATNIEEMKTR